MAPGKGPALEELVRAYFARQGFFALRSVPLQYEENDVTDLDVWLYARQSATTRVRAIVDVKNKKSPKAFERVLWVKGLQTVMKCDRAIVATTDSSPSLLRFAQSQKLDIDERLTLDELADLIQQNPGHKQDGDWLRILADAKSAVASLPGFPAFNRAMFAFRFFGERVEVRFQHREVALRGALLSAAIACVALDIGLERFVFSDVDNRHKGLIDGVVFGDSGDGRVQASIQTALEALSEGMQNGKAIAAQARQQLERRLEGVRAEVIAEYFMREHHAQHLFSAARELEAAAHTSGDPKRFVMSLETRSILGVFADFIGVRRSSLPIVVDGGAPAQLGASLFAPSSNAAAEQNQPTEAPEMASDGKTVASNKRPGEESSAGSPAEQPSDSNQRSLL